MPVACSSLVASPTWAEEGGSASMPGACHCNQRSLWLRQLLWCARVHHQGLHFSRRSQQLTTQRCVAIVARGIQVRRPHHAGHAWVCLTHSHTRAHATQTLERRPAACTDSPTLLWSSSVPPAGADVSPTTPPSSSAQTEWEPSITQSWHLATSSELHTERRESHNHASTSAQGHRHILRRAHPPHASSSGGSPGSSGTPQTNSATPQAKQQQDVRSANRSGRQRSSTAKGPSSPPPPPPSQTSSGAARRLTTLISESTSLQELQQLYSAHEQRLDAIHISAMLSKVRCYDIVLRGCSISLWAAPSKGCCL